MNLFQLPLLSEGRCVIYLMMDRLAKEQDHQDRMSTPIAYTTMTIDEALGYNTAIHTAGQGLLDGWLGILGYRGDATPQLIDPQPIWNRILSMTDNGAASMYLGSYNCGNPLGERLRSFITLTFKDGIIMHLKLSMVVVMAHMTRIG